MNSDFSVVFAPVVPWWAIAVLGAAGLALIALSLSARASGLWWRLLAVGGLLGALCNPLIVVEDRRGLPDIGIVVVDESKSQATGNRKERTEQALAALRERLGTQNDLELRVVRAGGGGGLDSDGTRLFAAVERALADVPRARLGGVVMITDGQVHDAPKAEAIAKDAWPAPVHVLLTGERGERDRRIVIEQAPTYAIVGKPQQLTLRIDDGPGVTGGTARVDLRRDGGEPQTLRLQIGVPQTIDFTLERAGTALFEIAVEPGPRELTLDNNRIVAAVSAVRDRLRVLLVTGEPHPGERTWRSLLKSDPSVDLVHFTILRPPEAQDFTPVNELSLIAFPIRELFEVKLNEFDLIIFDRYRRRDVLAQIYLDNITRWVRGGGALLLSVGPNQGPSNSLFNSPIGQIMPGVPTGRVIEQPFKPELTDYGRRHPVTAELPGAGSPGSEPGWGRWFRHVDADQRRGQTLLSGAANRPLLLLDRVGDGRVAQLQSDHIWLWARGFDGAGPHAELLRRIAHWLMKEPELEENDLRAAVKGGRIEITRRSLEPDGRPIEITTPTGEKRQVELREVGGGRATGSIDVSEPGLYHFSDGVRVSLAAVGALNPIEMGDVRTTDELLKPIVVASGGRSFWLADGLPELRRTRPGRETGGTSGIGRPWVGMQANNDYIVTGVSQTPLMPALAIFLLGLGALVAAWRREGR
ncbi:MAG: hypothetical protein JNK67_12205 [Alphaproteobacteria bacterium]|nr:hypothetical protein [Alphaproteobacteria bacterium]